MSEGAREELSEEARGWAVAADQSVWPGDKKERNWILIKELKVSPEQSSSCVMCVLVTVNWWTMFMIIRPLKQGIFVLSFGYPWRSPR